MGTSALNPKHATFLQKESLVPMEQHYGIREDNLPAEVHQVPQLQRTGKNRTKQLAAHWSSCPCLNLTKTPSWTSKTFTHICHTASNLRVRALRECSLSCMRRVKTYVRNRMTNPRLINLACLSTQKEPRP